MYTQTAYSQFKISLMSIVCNLRGVIMSHEQKAGLTEVMSEENLAGFAQIL